MSVKNSSTVTVYALSSSQDHAVRYIGQTVMTLRRRLNSHIHEAQTKRSNYKHHWINSVVAAGHDVLIVALKVNAVLHVDEIATIAHHKTLGCALVNLTTGGEGSPGCVLSPERCAQMAASMLGNQYGRGNKGSKFSAEHRAKLSAQLLGNQRGKGQAAWNKGVPVPQAVRDKIKSHAHRAPGAENPRAKLSEQDVVEIRHLLASGLPQADVALQYDIGQAQVCRIGRGQRWQHQPADDGLQAAIDAAAAAKLSGNGHPRAKLTDDDVATIKQSLAQGTRVAQLALQYGVSTVQIYRLKNGSRRSP